MNIAKSLSLAILLFFAVGCSLATKETRVNVSTENTTNSVGANQEETAAFGGPDANQSAETGERAVLPDTVIKDLYAAHARDFKDNSQDGIVSSKSRKKLDKYFNKNLADLIWKDMTTHEGEIGVIDFDIFYNTQDPDIKNLVVSPAKIEGTKATVPVNFVNSTLKETVTYLMVQENGAWKISDIKYKSGDTLLKYFKEYAASQKENASNNSDEDGNFEGTFQVGSTTATVKPIKTAFELKWAKGAGTMIFFYSGQGVLEYESEDTGNGVDKFIFDDTSFKTGKFIRGSDGKEMPVKKIS